MFSRLVMPPECLLASVKSCRLWREAHRCWLWLSRLDWVPTANYIVQAVPVWLKKFAAYDSTFQFCSMLTRRHCRPTAVSWLWCSSFSSSFSSIFSSIFSSSKMKNKAPALLLTLQRLLIYSYLHRSSSRQVCTLIQPAGFVVWISLYKKGCDDSLMKWRSIKP